ncbi:MAG: tetratricopeptide repeat protein [Paludibacteraceae bacterium]|nr:tetratricopeptide repeat protein [Paludibacteraceae bacterium]
MSVICCNVCYSQLNTARLTAIGRNALYFEDYVLSIQYFNQVIKVKPYLAEPYLYRAIAKIQLEDYGGALQDCNRAIENNPFVPGAYYTRGYVERQLEQYDKAEQDLTEALKFSPDNRIYLMLRSEVRAGAERYSEALEDIDFLLKKEPLSASINYEKGVILFSMQDTVGAEGYFAIAADNDRQNPHTWSSLGLMNLMLDKNDEALTNLTKAINLGSKWAGDYINRGVLYYRIHNYRGALADYDKAVELAPNDASVYYNRAILRSEVGDWNRAMDDIDKALDLQPEKTEMHYQRGIINLQLRQWQQAIKDFQKLIDTHPYFLPSYYLIAQAYTALDQPQNAYRYQHKAHELEEKKDQIQQHLDTDVQIAQDQPMTKDRRREFSRRAAQSGDDNLAEERYQSATRGNIQKRYVDVVSEPMFALSYYSKQQTLRQTNTSHPTLEAINQIHTLPAPLRLTLQEVSLTADLVEKHFEAISNLSRKIDKDDNDAMLYFARAIEFALVQDYNSALEDATRAIQRQPNLTLAYFCRATWRYKLLEYQRSTGEVQDVEYNKLAGSDQRFQNITFDLIMRDYDEVLRQQPDFQWALYNKAGILATQKAYNDAINAYTQAIEIDNDFAEAYFNRGLTRIYIDQNDAGLQDLSKAGELGIYQAYNLITRLK